MRYIKNSRSLTRCVGLLCVDIDECRQIDEVYCGGSLEICINTPGSFHCECQDGFYRVNDTCEGKFPHL